MPEIAPRHAGSSAPRRLHRRRPAAPIGAAERDGTARRAPDAHGDAHGITAAEVAPAGS